MSREESIKWLNALLSSDKKKPILRTGEICAIKKAIEVLNEPSLSSIIDEAAHSYRLSLQDYGNPDEVETSFKAGVNWTIGQLTRE